MKPSIKFVKRADGVKIAYTEFGKGEVLLFAAPWVTSLSYIIEDPYANRFWEKIAQVATVVLYDKHGCGQSDRDRTDFSLQTELMDLQTVVDHLGLEKFNLWGSSCSGPVTILYTFQYPEKVTRLILYGTYACGARISTEEFRPALVSLVKASWGVGSKALAGLFVPGASKEEFRSVAKFQRDSASPEIAAKLLELGFSLDVSNFLSSINIPTLILHREGDRAITINNGRQLAAEIPNAQFKLLKGAIHPWWHGETDEIINEVAEFIGMRESIASIPVSEKEDLEEDAAAIPTEETEIVEQATILFSDIVSSTDLVTQLGDSAARDIFLKHDQIIRKQVKNHGGRELQNLGDGFMLSFKSASAAIKCACEIQRDISKKVASIKVRIGINTGEVVRREGEHPFGQAVVVASRILSRAKGGQVLVSDVTKQLASGGGFSFLEKGRFKPKGFKESMKLYEVPWKGQNKVLYPTPK